jgi:hypothetical protein
MHDSPKFDQKSKSIWKLSRRVDLSQSQQIKKIFQIRRKIKKNEPQKGRQIHLKVE